MTCHVLSMRYPCFTTAAVSHLAVHVLRDDEKGPLALKGELHGGKKMLHRRDLLVVHQDERVLQLALLSLGLCT